MYWDDKSKMDEMYCAVHNVDCPLHDHSGDPTVLRINPGRFPSSWMCPQAVLELEEQFSEAETYLEQNQDDPAGFHFSEDWMENLAHDALAERGEDWAETLRRKMDVQGVESFTLEELDGLQYVLDEDENGEPEQVEQAQQEVKQYWEEAV